MDDNSLIGKNIRSLRHSYGETQEQLAEELGFEKTAISNYENNIRMPDNITLKEIAKHFSVSVEQLIHIDLTGIGKINYDEELYWKNIDKLYPIVANEVALSIESFRKAYIYHKALYRGCHRISLNSLHLIERHIEVYMDYIDKCIDSYLEAYKYEESKLAAAVNYIAVIFFLKSIFINSQNVMSNRPAILKQVTSKNSRIEQLFDRYNSESKEQSEILDLFEDQELLNDIKEKLTELKHSKEYSDIADYYLALQYFNGLINNGMTLELKTTVGFEMLNSLVFIGNSYAIELLKLMRRVFYGSSQNVDDN